MSEQIITVLASDLRVGDAVIQVSADTAWTITRLERKGEYGVLVWTAPHDQLLREYLTFERVLVLR